MTKKVGNDRCHSLDAIIYFYLIKLIVSNWIFSVFEKWKKNGRSRKSAPAQLVQFWAIQIVRVIIIFCFFCFAALLFLFLELMKKTRSQISGMAFGYFSHKPYKIIFTNE